MNMLVVFSISHCSSSNTTRPSYTFQTVPAYTLYTWIMIVNYCDWCTRYFSRHYWRCFGFRVVGSGLVCCSVWVDIDAIIAWWSVALYAPVARRFRHWTVSDGYLLNVCLCVDVASDAENGVTVVAVGIYSAFLLGIDESATGCK